MKQKKFIWIKDYEKVFAFHIIFGFWWVLCWLFMTWIVNMWVNLPSDNPVMFVMGLSALVGFVFVMGRGIVLLIIGMVKELIKGDYIK